MLSYQLIINYLQKLLLRSFVQVILAPLLLLIVQPCPGRSEAEPTAALTLGLAHVIRE